LSLRAASMSISQSSALITVRSYKRRERIYASVRAEMGLWVAVSAEICCESSRGCVATVASSCRSAGVQVKLRDARGVKQTARNHSLNAKRATVQRHQQGHTARMSAERRCFGFGTYQSPVRNAESCSARRVKA
jgi:hypothetical protein